MLFLLFKELLGGEGGAGFQLQFRDNGAAAQNDHTNNKRKEDYAQKHAEHDQIITLFLRCGLATCGSTAIRFIIRRHVQISPL